MTGRHSLSASRSYFGETAVGSHEQTILDFLYEEGPHTSPDIVQHLGLSKDRTATILSNMHSAGQIASLHMGSPPKPHWILAEDAK